MPEVRVAKPDHEGYILLLDKYLKSIEDGELFQALQIGLVDSVIEFQRSEVEVPLMEVTRAIATNYFYGDNRAVLPRAQTDKHLEAFDILLNRGLVAWDDKTDTGYLTETAANALLTKPQKEAAHLAQGITLRGAFIEQTQAFMSGRPAGS